MRSFQGILFLGVGLFVVKWHVAPTGNTFPPLKAWMLHYMAGFFAAIGVYLLITGEVATWRKQRRRASYRTSLSSAAAFLTTFSAKWAYGYEPRMGYYPPFNEESLCLVFLSLSLLTVYYLALGEFDYWRRTSE